MPTQSDKENPSLGKSFFANITKVSTTGIGVAVSLFPLDVVMHFLHTNPWKGFSKDLKLNPWLNTTLKYSMAKILGGALLNSTKASTLKNGVLSQRHKVDEVVSKRTEDESVIAKAKPVIVGGIIGSLDTMCTQYHSNLKVWNAQAGFDAKFINPNPSNFKEKVKVWSKGLGIRSFKNSINVTGFFLTPYFENKLSALGSEKMAKLGAPLVSGLLVGSISNSLDIVYRNQLIKVDPKTFTVPSAIETTKELILNEGPKALKRGLFTSILYAGVAYAVVPKWEGVADRCASKAEELYDKAQNGITKIGFFKKAEITKVDVSKTSEAEQKPGNKK